MSQNKKFTGILLITLLPLIGAFINGSINGKNVNNFSTLAFIIAILGCGFIIILNFYQTKESFWYTLPIALGLSLGLFLYFGLSLTNFGF